MKVTVYTESAGLPQLPAGNFFHSRQLMELCEKTPRMRPYMAVAIDDDGRCTAHLLAVLRRRKYWLPSFFVANVRIYGDNGCQPDVFGNMIEAITQKLYHRSLYIEISNLSQKMFGYRQLRVCGYFPVRWMSIHNSLHSRTPEERITSRQLKRIERARSRGAQTKTVETESEFKAFSRLLRQHNWLKPQRYLPADELFRGMVADGHCQLFITTFRQKVIGCAVCVFSDEDAYLWYSAAKRKSFAPLHPNATTIWETICYAHRKGMQHIRFMDVGLPLRKNTYRDFILRFGGKEVSTYRWFRINIRWINRMASWLWRE